MGLIDACQIFSRRRSYIRSVMAKGASCPEFRLAAHHYQRQTGVARRAEMVQ